MADDSIVQPLERRIAQLGDKSSQTLLFLSFALVVVATLLDKTSSGGQMELRLAMWWWACALFPILAGIVPLKEIRENNQIWYRILRALKFVLLWLALILIGIGAYHFLKAIKPFLQSQSFSAVVAPSIQRQIMDLERQGWEAAKRRDAATASRIFADDALDVGGYGILNKKQSVESLASLSKHPGVELYAYNLSNWQFRKASDDVIVVALRAKLTGISNGKQLPSIIQYSSEVWVKRDSCWRLLLIHNTITSPKT